MSNQLNFIKAFLPIAKAIQSKYNIPYLVTLAQSAVESAWGTKAPGNNYFGIKASTGWTGKTQDFLTTEIVTPEQLKGYTNIKTIQKLESGNYKITVIQKFRAYSTSNESFIDYANLLSNTTRYKTAFNETNPYRFAEQIARAGYATAPGYGSTLQNYIDVIKKKLIQQPMEEVAC